MVQDKWYTTSLTPRVSCDCGYPHKHAKPCAHEMKHAQSIGQDIMTLIDKKDTTEGWQRQYPEDVEFRIPSLMNVLQNQFYITACEHEETGDKGRLQLPHAVRKSRGRPESHKRKLSSKEKVVGKNRCSKCQKVGHRKDKCPNMRVSSGAGTSMGGGGGGAGVGWGGAAGAGSVGRS